MSGDFHSRLRGSIPEGGRVREQLTITDAEGQANVIASIEAVAPDIDARRYADIMGQELERDLTDYHEMSFEPALVFGGRPGYSRRFAHTANGAGERITQIQHYYAFAGQGYVATATTRTATFEKYEATLQDLLDGLSLGPATDQR